MSSENSFPRILVSRGEIQLQLRGLGHVPSFKNTKMLTRGKLITHPRKQQWMQRAIHALKSQLKYLSLTVAPATSTARSQPFWIAWLPSDDNCKVILKETVSVRRVPKGEEGAIITVRKLPTPTPRP